MLQPCQRHPSLHSVLRGHGILALAVFLAAFTTAQGADTDRPPDPNPVEFVRFESSKAGKDDLELAALGEILNGNQYKAVEIWTTLQVGDLPLIHLPKGCHPGKSKSKELDSVSLTYFYGKKGAFTQAYLAVGMPDQYFSLTFLSQMVLLTAPERTLSLNVRNLTIWSSLKADMKTALIHDRVSKTLERALRNATGNASTALDGTLFIRNVSHTPHEKGRLTIEIPYLFFSGDRFTQCTRRGLVSWLGGIFLCTHFSQIEGSKTYPWILNSTYFMLYCTLVFLSNIIGHGVWKGEVPFYHDYCANRQRPGAWPKLDGSFPSSLSISATFFGASPVDTEKRKGMQTYRYSLLLGLATVAVLALNVALIPVSAAKHYTSMYDTHHFGSEVCVRDGIDYTRPLAYAVTFFDFVAPLIYTVIVYKHLPNFNGNGAAQVKIQISCVTFVALSALFTFLAIFATLNFINLAIIASIKLGGLLFFHLDLMLIYLASFLTIWHLIFELGRMNATISPEIAMCKASLDQASSELQAEAHKKATPTILSKKASEQSTQDQAVKKFCDNLNLPSVRMHALLKLCAHHVLKDLKEDNTTATAVGVSMVMEKPNEYEEKQTFERLRSTIIEAFWMHFGKSIAKSFIVFFLVFVLQTILAHYDDLIETSNIFKYVLPVSAIARYVIDFVKARLQSSKGLNVDPVLKAKATRILVDLGNGPPLTPLPASSSASARPRHKKTRSRAKKKHNYSTGPGSSTELSS